MNTEAFTSSEPTHTWARTLAVAAVLADATAALARIAGDAGATARSTLAAWQGLAREARAAEVARTVAAVRAPVPAGANRVDRGWVEAALDDDPRARAGWEARRADPAGVWWARRVTAAWISLPPADPAAAIDLPADLARWPADRIVAAMRRVGLAVVAHVMIEAGDTAIARVAASVVDGTVIVELARRLRADPELRAALGPPRPAAARVRAIDIQTDVGLGASTIARHLGGDAGVQVRLLVPPDVARRMDGDGIEVGWGAIRRLIGP